MRRLRNIEDDIGFVEVQLGERKGVLYRYTATSKQALRSGDATRRKHISFSGELHAESLELGPHNYFRMSMKMTREIEGV